MLRNKKSQIEVPKCFRREDQQKKYVPVLTPTRRQVNENKKNKTEKKENMTAKKITRLR